MLIKPWLFHLFISLNFDRKVIYELFKLTLRFHVLHHLNVVYPGNCIMVHDRGYPNPIGYLRVMYVFNKFVGIIF